MSKIAKATIGLVIVSLLSKVLGFGRELALASTYGASKYTDAYLIALNIPIVISSLIGGALGTTFIPIYCEINSNGGERNSVKFSNNVFNVVIIISMILIISALIFVKPLVSVFAMGFTGEVLDLAVNFTRILLPGILFIGLSNLMMAYLQIKNNFIIPGLISIPYNLITIVAMFFSIKHGMYIMIIGTLIGIVSQFLIQLPFVYKEGFRYKVYINIKDKDLKKMLWLLGPVFIGVAVNQVNAMIDRTLASTLVEGSIAALNYANKLNGFILVLFIASISTVIYPMLSKLSSENNKEEFTKTIVVAINSIIILVMPITVGAIIFSHPIVKILFQRGAFDANATKMTSIALIFYSIGLVGFGLRDILGKVFYSLQDTKTPMINGALAMCMNIVLNIILVKYMGHAGLALATSISSIICIILLFKSLNKKVGYFGQDKIIKTTIKSIIASAIMGIISYLTYKELNYVLNYGFIEEVVCLFSSILIGATVYGALAIILKIEEISSITYIVKKKLKR